MIKKGSLITIDLLRAAAALGVFYYHQHVGSLLAKYTRWQALAHTDNFGATYAVPLFFLLSGYCIHLSNLKYLQANKPLPLKEYYIARFLRIYPPYLFALLFAIAVQYFTYGKSPSTGDFLWHLLALQGFSSAYFNTINAVLWTITVEIAFYLIYPLFYAVRQKGSLTKALIFTFIVSVTSILICSYHDGLTFPTRFLITNLWFAWCWGAYLADNDQPLCLHLQKPWFLAFNLLVIVAFAAIRIIPDNLPIVFDQLNILIWTLPFLWVISNEQWIRSHSSLPVRIFSAIGLSSYSLYLLHQPLIILKNYLTHRFVPEPLQLPVLSAGIVAIPAICWLSFKYIETPFTKRKKVLATTAA
ncbi:acyltransferase [Mucilaginibacter terrenus]|uniref:Acyltransferase n=1 Tax=Mucilaginibacter terrenus TaxID=2482727 RepID=A0A3E2NMN0_9SPHI|nr:acyltransferase [Mucilaginibacter terrenus]RFZ82238.1 acyltransferase [Mucilaginibacter terrenus]